MNNIKSRVHLNAFDAKEGFSRERPVLVFALWYLLKILFFLTPVPWPSRLKCFILRAFGTSIGSGCVIKPRVNIHFPWKLKLGDNVWLGEEVSILNLESVNIGDDCCISQRAFLCTGNHDFRQAHMPYRNAPIRLESGSWISALVFVGPGVVVGVDTVVTVGSVVTASLEAGQIYSGNPCIKVRTRWGDYHVT